MWGGVGLIAIGGTIRKKKNVLPQTEQKIIVFCLQKKNVLHLAILVPRRYRARRHLPHDDAKNEHGPIGDRWKHRIVESSHNCATDQRDTRNLLLRHVHPGCGHIDRFMDLREMDPHGTHLADCGLD